MTRLCVLMILFAFGSVSANVYSQGSKLTLKMKSSKLADVFNSIEEQTNYYFFYNRDQLNDQQIVSVDVENKNIEEVLDELFRGKNITYTINDRNILIEVKGSSLLNMMQQKNISGKVTDSSGVPLPGVTVVVKGTPQGIITDADGNYSFPKVPANATLVFSFVGMRTQEIAVAGKTEINIVMQEETVGIEEVVAVGYGTQKKANLTGSVATASAERLGNRPIPSIEQGLQGVIPNLNITFDSGDPSEDANVNIRGYESINGGNPLILVDGVPMEWRMINPDDVESISVLKDAASAAVYGARGAFGVILVTTKKAKGNFHINFSSEFSMARFIDHLNPINDSYDYAVLSRKITTDNVGADPYFTDDQIAGYKEYHDNPTKENEWGVLNGVLNFYGNNNFKHYMLNNYAPQTKNQINISGETGNASYYVSFGQLNKKGYYRRGNMDYNRYNILMKVDYKLKKWLSLYSKISLNIEKNDSPHDYGTWDRGLNATIRIKPMVPIKFPDLEYYLEPGDHDQFSQYIGMYNSGARNAPMVDKGGRELTDSYDTWLSQGITLTPLKGLSIKSDFSYNIFHKDYEKQQTKIEMVNSFDLYNMKTTYSQSGNDYMLDTNNYNRYYVFNAYADYTLDKFTDHYLEVMCGFNQEWGRYQYISAKAYNLVTTTVRDLNATTGTQYADGAKDEVALRGAFYRLTYRYKNKYLFESDGRYDLTSRFPKNNRSDLFPSVSCGWRISKENFMESTANWLDNLMLRVSIGSLGNQLLGDDYYPYIATMGSGLCSEIFSTGTSAYVSPSGLVSNNLTWETVVTKNIGLDFTLFKNRLEVSADKYIRKTKDMLMTKEYPSVLGTDAPESNAADLKNNGWELSVHWRDKIDKDWKYEISLALSDSYTKITKYDNPTGAVSDYYIGKKIGEIWGYESAGIFQNEENIENAADQSQVGTGWEPGDMQYVDRNSDGKITPGDNTLDNPGDRKIIGNSSPRYCFGINTTISFRNWSMDMFFQGLFRDYYPTTQGHTDFWPYNTDSWEKSWGKESWSEDNRNAYFTKPRYFRVCNQSKNFQSQTHFLQNASYIRLKNLTINYSLPENFINKLGIEKVQLYLSGMNLWEYSKIHKPLDPEYIVSTTQDYYLQRIYALGLKVMF